MARWQVSNLVFYAQSTIAVISERNTFCYRTIYVKKKLNTLKLVLCTILKRDLKDE